MYEVLGKVVAEVMMIRELWWTLNTIPSPFDPQSLFVFPWPILEASSHFYFGSCFGFTLITTLTWIAKSSLFGFGQKYLESDWLLMSCLGLSLAQWNPHKLTLKAFWRGDLNNKSPFRMCFAVWFSLSSSGVKSWKSVKIEYSVAVLLTVSQLAKQMNHGSICLASLRSSDNI